MINADRYLFDVAVDIGLTLGWALDHVIAFALGRLAKLPLTQVKVFLPVAHENSFQRKNDIFDIDYLRLRLRFSYYEAIVQAFGFGIRDGTLPIAKSCAWLLAEIDAATRRPFAIYTHATNSNIGGPAKVLRMMAEYMRDGGGCRVPVVVRLQTAIIQACARAGIAVIHHPFLCPQVSKGIGGIIRFTVTAPRKSLVSLVVF